LLADHHNKYAANKFIITPIGDTKTIDAIEYESMFALLNNQIMKPINKQIGKGKIMELTISISAFKSKYQPLILIDIATITK